jgi:hypothetical protein
MRMQGMTILTGDVALEVRSDRDGDGGHARSLYSCLSQGTAESNFNDLELGVGHPKISDPRLGMERSKGDTPSVHIEDASP